MNAIASFVTRKWPYFIGFAIIEGGIYYFNGATGNFTTGFAGLFCIWLYYVWSYREDYKN